MSQAECSGQQSSGTGPGGVPTGAKTSDYYRVDKIPARFDNPGKCYVPGNPVFSNVKDIAEQAPPQPRQDEWFEGYNAQSSHPVYRTSNSSYGSRPPSVHTMPTEFHAKSHGFSKHLGSCGMYRNHSLNTCLDKSNTPEH